MLFYFIYDSMISCQRKPRPLQLTAVNCSKTSCLFWNLFRTRELSSSRVSQTNRSVWAPFHCAPRLRPARSRCVASAPNLKMSTQFSLTSQRQQKRFSIDDAFEEETDEAIRVYGATTPRSPQADVRVGDQRSFKIVNDTSRDSDSLIQDCCDNSSQDFADRSCLRHPKVRENWRMVLAASTLLVIGVGLLTTGTVSLAEPNSGLQGSVFLLAGFICFVPGAYHVVYIYLAAKGKRGYHFHNLPLFT